MSEALTVPEAGRLRFIIPPGVPTDSNMRYVTGTLLLRTGSKLLISGRHWTTRSPRVKRGRFVVLPLTYSGIGACHSIHPGHAASRGQLTGSRFTGRLDQFLHHFFIL